MMAKRTQVLIVIPVAAALIGAVAIISMQNDSKLEPVAFQRGTIKVDDVELEVQIADNQVRRGMGLSFQEQLPYDQGMLFVFENPGNYSFWMVDMKFSLDIIWFDNDGKVVHIETDLPPCETAPETMNCPKTNSGDKEAVYILEVTAGFIDEFGITEDSSLEIISI